MRGREGGWLAVETIATGLLDADIYGPSMPRMLAVKEKPESADGKMLKPIERYGLRTMSIGYIVAEDTSAAAARTSRRARRRSRAAGACAPCGVPA